MFPDGTLGLVIDCTIILLLVATMVSTWLMYRRLQAVQAVKSDFEQMITDFLRAATRAEDALKGMTLTAEDVSERLDKAIQRGELTSSELQVMLESGERIAARMDAAVDKASGMNVTRDRDPLDHMMAMEDAAPATSAAPAGDLNDYEALADRAARQMIQGVETTPAETAEPAPSPEATAQPLESASLTPGHEADQGMSNVFLQAEAQGIDPFDALFDDTAPPTIRKVVPMPTRSTPPQQAPRQTAQQPAQQQPTSRPAASTPTTRSRSEQELAAALQAARRAAQG
ncbi:MAG: hypothetical protein Alpg2KO_12910 [Alphaproteobacteria bacterium]